ncbi:MAG: ABC transporter permease [Acidimicrobiia bacterium]|nr:ABC transporter permease [Acidimicrobiia bacterium]
MTRFWTEVGTVFRRDVVAEWRRGEVATVVLPFAVVALMVFPLAIGIDLPLLSRIGPAVFWAILLLFGMQVGLRVTSTENAVLRDALALTGSDPLARFVGRTASTTALLLGFSVVLYPAMAIFYYPDTPNRWLPLVGIVALFVIGLGQLVTLAAQVTIGLGGRNSLAPLLIAPLAIPLVVGASQAMASMERGGSILNWTLLVIAVDLALVITAILVARPLEEASR